MDSSKPSSNEPAEPSGWELNNFRLSSTTGNDRPDVMELSSLAVTRGKNKTTTKKKTLKLEV